MSLYIHLENQKRIWENISKHPQFQHFDPTHNGTGEKKTWFREIIQFFYENNKFKILSVQDLQQLNRETMTYMIHSIKKLEKEYENNPIGASSGSLQEAPATSLTVSRGYISEKKQEDMNRHFNERQKEYDSMLTRKPSEPIDFKIQMTDEPIENMDELIRIHTQQRENDIKITAPEPTNKSNDDYNNHSINIHKELQSLRQQLKDFNDNMNETIKAMRIEIDTLKQG